MKLPILIVLNLGLAGLFFHLLRKRDLLSFSDHGKFWLTWLSVAIITLMDELTSVFYVAAESYLIVGLAAFVFIIVTSLLMRFLSNRMVEISHILEEHGIRGGGVYSFSYMVLGPTVSFVAVASIMVDYILTAAISTVAAVYNGGSFFHLSTPVLYGLMFAVVWGVALLNIIGIRENARFTFYVFIAAAMVLVTLIVSAIIDPSPGQLANVGEGFKLTWHGLTHGGVFDGISFFIFGTAGVILAYSGIESVVQTAGLVKTWHEIRKAYLFLAVTVGVATPLITMLVLTRTDIDFRAHENDLITYFSGVLNGPWFAYAVGALASFTLIMAVNTAFVASSELLERVAERYHFEWLMKTNKAHSLVRIHLINATLFTVIIALTAGSQEMLAHMYAVGLVASFTINMGALVIYRYRRGTEEIGKHHTSRTGTLIIFIILLACFGFIAYHKWQGFLLWVITVVIFQIVGARVTDKRDPESKERKKHDNPIQVTTWLEESDPSVPFHVHFRRAGDTSQPLPLPDHVYITFYSARSGAPKRYSENHLLFPYEHDSVARSMITIIKTIEYDFKTRDIRFHLGWPTASWIDRLSTGVMVFSLMRLPNQFKHYSFSLEYAAGELKESTEKPLSMGKRILAFFHLIDRIPSSESAPSAAEATPLLSESSQEGEA